MIRCGRGLMPLKRVIANGKNGGFFLPIRNGSCFNMVRFYASSEFGGKKDGGFNIKNFLIVALVGTGIFGAVVQRVNSQDASKSMLKRKKSYSDEEWEQYMNNIKRKVLLFDPIKDREVSIFFVPEVDLQNKNDSLKLNQLQEKLGDSIVVDLNDLIKDELLNHQDRYGSLLEANLENPKEDQNRNYKFNYRLAKGVFSKMMRLKLEELKNSNSLKYKNYILINFPNNINEAIKFEQDVAISKKLILFHKPNQNNEIADYFKTVDKTVVLEKVTDDTIKSLLKDEDDQN
ncbi:hypothetical protein PACTADRAFT_14598 [Pachysolen tannophilus NRRL Y-2460]|uniref:Altered inheritance of mitochondria protein 36, mitochondrial n=1 Tax=Pachysolen tannophilus NRRL Y-2460 TaxID=669874 RepID=A0A1E4U288_PACTA|nr:hypothetical protein PACTADRAFT_14598 [Pachysolen tannophilus NRRL Y-2460]